MLSILKKKEKDPNIARKAAMRSLKLSLSEMDNVRDEFILKLQTKRKYISDVKECEHLDFRETSKIEYVDKVFMKDLSTDEQVQLGLNIFHVTIDKTTSSPLHFHEARSQLLFIIEGSIYDKLTKMTFNAGESYFISKRNSHSIRYLEGSELLFIYIPSLKIIDDEQK